jgi:type I restriction enzyme S subunit
MNKIDKLIEELCPEGIEQSRIGDFAKCVAGATPRTGDERYWEDGTIPWMSSGEVNKGTVTETDNFITKAGFDSCSTKMLPAGTVVIALAGQGKTRGMVARTRIQLCTNQSLCGIIPDDSIDADFLYHFLKSRYRQLRDMSSGDGGRGGLNLEIVRSVVMPVPPLQVQQEIVSILDKFTELETELEAELEARVQQFEHLRERLFSGAGRAQSIKLGELCELYSGEFVKKDRQGDHFEFPVYNGGSEPTGFYSEANSPQDSIVIASRGSIGSVSFVETRFWAGNSCFVLKNPLKGITYRYLYHFLKHSEPELYKLKAVGTIPALNLKPLLKFEVPVPDLASQNRIAAYLDSFERLETDNSRGIPAEITARRQQYEYYRNKLLTFKELKAS